MSLKCQLCTNQAVYAGRVTLCSSCLKKYRAMVKYKQAYLNMSRSLGR